MRRGALCTAGESQMQVPLGWTWSMKPAQRRCVVHQRSCGKAWHACCSGSLPAVAEAGGVEGVAHPALHERARASARVLLSGRARARLTIVF